MIPEGNGRIIGYYGYPRRSLLAAARRDFGANLPVVDLDIDHGAPDSGLLPQATCRIIANIMNNAVRLSGRLAVVVASVGEDKCDGGRNIAWLLKGMGFNVVESRFPSGENEDRPLVWSTCSGPLAGRIDRIMETVVDPPKRATLPRESPAGTAFPGELPVGASLPGESPAGAAFPGELPAGAAPRRCEPTHGFWGVPPNDFRILGLFPPATHIYGWTRCVEAGRPADMDLECFVDPGVPTVFFTQSFCAKQDLAHYLAEKHGGLEVDCHREINDSIMAKVEAFIKLS